MSRKLIAAMVVLSAIGLGCAGGMSANKSGPAEKEMTSATVVVCPACGHSFKLGAALTEAEKAE